MEWIESDAVSPEIESAWSDLVERSAAATVFQTPEWVDPWRRHFGERLRLLCVRRGERLVALVPLAWRKERHAGLSARTLSFAGEPLADQHGILYERGDTPALDACARSLAVAARGVDLVRLGELASGSPVEEALERAAAGARLARTARTCARAPVVDLRAPWEEIERGFSRSLAVRLDRARKRQAREGGFLFRRWLPEPEEVSGIVDRFGVIEEKSWKGETGVGIFSPSRIAFVTEMATRCARKRWLDVATLSRKDRLVAYRFGFRFRDVFFDYNLAHDPDADAFSPGRTLLDEIVRDSHRIGLAAVDASRGRIAPPHLLADWTKESRWHTRRTWFGTSATGRLLAFWEAFAKPAARRLLRGGRRVDPT